MLLLLVRESRNEVKMGFEKTFFYPIIDLMLSEINRCFSRKNCDIMNSIQALNPKNDAFLKETALH